MAMTTAPANAAATPTASSWASARRTSRLTPAIPAMPQITVRGVSRSPSSAAESPAVISGWTAPTVAATPPGRR